MSVDIYVPTGQEPKDILKDPQSVEGNSLIVQFYSALCLSTVVPHIHVIQSPNINTQRVYVASRYVCWPTATKTHFS